MDQKIQPAPSPVMLDLSNDQGIQKLTDVLDHTDYFSGRDRNKAVRQIERQYAGQKFDNEIKVAGLDESALMTFTQKFKKPINVRAGDFTTRWSDVLQNTSRAQITRAVKAISNIEQRLAEYDNAIAYLEGSNPRDGENGFAVRADCWIRNQHIAGWFKKDLGSENVIFANTGKAKGDTGYHAFILFRIGDTWFSADSAADQFEPDIFRSSDIGLVIMPAGRGNVSINEIGEISFEKGANTEWAFSENLRIAGSGSLVYGETPKVEVFDAGYQAERDRDLMEYRQAMGLKGASSPLQIKSRVIQPTRGRMQMAQSFSPVTIKNFDIRPAWKINTRQENDIIIPHTTREMETNIDKAFRAGKTARPRGYSVLPAKNGVIVVTEAKELIKGIMPIRDEMVVLGEEADYKRFYPLEQGTDGNAVRGKIAMPETLAQGRILVVSKDQKISSSARKVLYGPDANEIFGTDRDLSAGTMVAKMQSVFDSNKVSPGSVITVHGDRFSTPIMEMTSEIENEVARVFHGTNKSYKLVPTSSSPLVTVSGNSPEEIMKGITMPAGRQIVLLDRGKFYRMTQNNKGKIVKVSSPVAPSSLNNRTIIVAAAGEVIPVPVMRELYGKSAGVLFDEMSPTAGRVSETMTQIMSVRVPASSSPVYNRFAQRRLRRPVRDLQVRFKPIAVNLKVASVAASPMIQQVTAQGRVVVDSGDVARWMLSHSRGKMNKSEAEHVSGVLATLLRDKNGMKIIEAPERLEKHFKENNIGISRASIDTVAKAAKMLRETPVEKLPFPLSQAIVMNSRKAIETRLGDVGGQIMTQSLDAGLREVEDAVKILQVMVRDNKNILNQHPALIKKKLLEENKYRIKPELVDIIVKVITEEGRADHTQPPKIQFFAPASKPQSGKTPKTIERQINEATQYYGAKDFHLYDQMSETARARPLEVKIAVHFLENIRPEGAEFIREMDAQKRLSSRDVQGYVQAIKRIETPKLVKIINKNAAYADLKNVSKQFEENYLPDYNTLRIQLAETGESTRSMPEMANKYVTVYLDGKEKKVPYILAASMAERSRNPDGMTDAVKYRMSVEPLQTDAIRTLSVSSPVEISQAMKAAGKVVGMEDWEIDGLVEATVRLEMEVDSTQDPAKLKKLLDKEKSFLVHALVNKPDAVVWLAQVTNPIRPGDRRIVIDRDIAWAIPLYAGVPVMRYDDTYGRVEMLAPGASGIIEAVPFTQKQAVLLRKNNIEPVIVGRSSAEIRKVMEDVFTTMASESLRKRNPRASKLMQEIPKISAIVRAEETAAKIMSSKGSRLDLRTATVIPTQFAQTDQGDDRIVLIGVTEDQYKILRTQQKRNVASSSTESEIYFFNKDGSFSRYKPASSPVERLFGAREEKMPISAVLERMYLQNAAIVFPSNAKLSQKQASEFFGEKYYRVHRGAKVNLADTSITLTDQEIDQWLETVGALDEDMSNKAFNGRRVTGSKGSDLKIFSGITVTDSGENEAWITHVAKGLLPGGKTRGDQYFITLTPDLVLNSDKIMPAVLNTPVKGGMKLTDKAKTFLSQALDEMKADDTNKLAQTALRTVENVIHNPYAKVRIKRMEATAGREYIANMFPDEVTISDLNRLVNHMANIKGAHEVRAALTAPVITTQYVDAGRQDHRKYARDLMEEKGVEAASQMIAMRPIRQEYEQKQATQEAQRAMPVTSVAGLPGSGTAADDYLMKKAASPITEERTSSRTDVYEMRTGPPVAASPVIPRVPVAILPLPAVSSPVMPATVTPITPITPVITPMLLGTKRTPGVHSGIEQLAKMSSPVETRDPATWTSLPGKNSYPIFEKIDGKKYLTGIVNPGHEAISFDQPIAITRQRIPQFKDFGKDFRQHQVDVDEELKPTARVLELSDRMISEIQTSKGIDLTQRNGVKEITHDMSRVVGDSGNRVFVVPRDTYSEMMAMSATDYNDFVRPKVNAALAKASSVDIRKSVDPQYLDHKIAALKYFKESPEIRLVTTNVEDLNKEIKISIQSIRSPLTRAQAMETFDRKFPGVTTTIDGKIFVTQKAVERFSDYHMQEIGRGDLLASNSRINKIEKLNAVYRHEANVIANPNASYRDIIAKEAVKQPILPKGITRGNVQRVDSELFKRMMSSPQYVDRMRQMKVSSPVFDRSLSVERHMRSIETRDEFTRARTIPAQIVRLGNRTNRSVDLKEAQRASDLFFRYGNSVVYGGSVDAISKWLREEYRVSSPVAEVTARVEVMRRDIRNLIYRIESVQGTFGLEDRVGSGNARILARKIVEAKVNNEIVPGSVSIISMPEGFNDYATVIKGLDSVGRERILIVEEKGGDNIFYDTNGRVVEFKKVSEKVNVIIGRSGVRVNRANQDIDDFFARAMAAGNDSLPRYRIDPKPDVRRIDGRSYDVTRMGRDYNSSPLAMSVNEAIQKGFKIDSVEVIPETGAYMEILRAALPKNTGLSSSPAELNDVTVIVRAPNGEQRLLISPIIALEIESGRRTSLLKENPFTNEFEQVVGLRADVTPPGERESLAGRMYKSLLGGVTGSKTPRGIPVIKYDRELSSLNVGNAIDRADSTKTPMLGGLATFVDGYAYTMGTPYATGMNIASTPDRTLPVFDQSQQTTAKVTMPQTPAITTRTPGGVRLSSSS
ncbi:MAG: hypothetical protein KAS66_03880, partial [Candidatus Omnitrophica bacterium]|nr:hypothetical protein [Candidatus Omnitrophota bacterium]